MPKYMISVKVLMYNFAIYFRNSVFHSSGSCYPYSQEMDCYRFYTDPIAETLEKIDLNRFKIILLQYKNVASIDSKLIKVLFWSTFFGFFFLRI